MAVIVAVPAPIADNVAPLVVKILLSEEVNTHDPVESETGALIVNAGSPTVTAIGKNAPSAGIAPNTWIVICADAAAQIGVAA